MDLERRLNETNDDEKRRRLLYEVERLRVTNVELKVALRLQSWRRRARKKNCAGPQLRRVRRAASRPSGQKKISAPSSREQCPLHQLNGHHGEQEELQDAPSASTAPAAPATEESPVDASRHTNAGGRGEEGPMRHFHKLISLEPVSEADEHPGGGEGGGLGGLGGSLMGSESPLSSGPSSLSPTPGIGDVWNDLVPSSGGSGLGSGPSSGSSSPGGESLGGSPGASLSPEQLGSHPVLYWQLMRDHLQLQRAYQQLQQLQASSRSNDRQARAKLEAQVYDLKRALSRRSASSGSALNDALQDVAELRQREESLIAELAELRDQNELLEFRLLELEGIVDKSSVCSGTRDVCTDTESDTVTEDSGLLSLGASDDGEAIDSTAVRERLALLASSMQTEADRGCLQRALQLLDNYQQHFGKDASVKASPPSSAAKQPNQRIVATVLPFTEAAIDVETDDTKLSSREEFRRKQEFFNQMQRLGHLHHSNTGSNNTKKSLKQSDCLQESGIFEGDSEDGVVSDLASRATQTEEIQTCSCHQQDSEDSPLAVDTEIPFSSLPAFVSPKKTPPEPAAAGALSEEIQKLSQIRERIEEQGTVSKLKLPEAAPVALPGVGSAQLQLKLCELEFFRSRAAALEAKLAELERCSDPELRGCARLLERVAALERQAREARESADMLVRRNRDLEEERCELEEAENDTRLRCQQLEVEVVQLREREGALELELGRARRSLSDAHQLQGRLEMALQSLETRNFELEEAECELRASIAAVESALPATVAFHLAHYKHYLQMRERPAQTGPNSVCSVAVSTEDPNEPDTTEEDAEAMEQDAVIPAAKRDDSDVLERLAQLMAAEKDMHQKIAFLEQKESAFQETLAAADGLWTEMELNYKRRLARAEEAEEELRSKVRRLEDSECKLRQAVSEQTALSERVAELEVQERALVSRIRTLEQDKQSVSEEAARRHDDLKAARAALAALQERVQGPIAQELAAERRRADELAEELRGRQDVLVALEQRASIEISALQAQITAGEKTLQDMEVTCAELREEVDTLEEAVSSLRNELSVAHDKAERHLFHMESAVADRDRLLDQLKLLEAHPTAALHHEMAVAAASRQPEEDDETSPSPPVSFAPAAVSFRKSLQAFRSCETKASKPPTPPKPVPKKEAGQVAPFTSLPTMPTATASKKTPPPLPPKITTSVKWQRADNSSPCGS